MREKMIKNAVFVKERIKILTNKDFISPTVVSSEVTWNDISGLAIAKQTLQELGKLIKTLQELI